MCGDVIEKTTDNNDITHHVAEPSPGRQRVDPLPRRHCPQAAVRNHHPYFAFWDFSGGDRQGKEKKGGNFCFLQTLHSSLNSLLLGFKDSEAGPGGVGEALLQLLFSMHRFTKGSAVLCVYTPFGVKGWGWHVLCTKTFLKSSYIWIFDPHKEISDANSEVAPPSLRLLNKEAARNDKSGKGREGRGPLQLKSCGNFRKSFLNQFKINNFLSAVKTPGS